MELRYHWQTFLDIFKYVGLPNTQGLVLKMTCSVLKKLSVGSLSTGMQPSPPISPQSASRD